jgi:Flp pilus assembly protein TadG
VLEVALVLPVLVGLTMGSIEFGYFMYAKSTAQAAARDGARNAILGISTQATATTAISRVMTAAGMQSTGYTTSFVNATTGATITDVSTVPAGTDITVRVSLTFGSLNVRPLGVVPASKPVVGSTTMTKE